MPDQMTPEQQAIIQELSGRTDLSPDQKAIVDELMRRISSQSTPEAPKTESLLQRTARTARPYLQTVGATAGGILGAGSGLLTGPGAVVASPAGALTGGALGFAIGDEVADLLENWTQTRKPKTVLAELSDVPLKVAEGATYEMGGQAVGKALATGGKALAEMPVVRYGIESAKEMAGKAPAMTEEAVKKLAGKFLIANTSKGPIITRNIEKASAIEEQIPGLKFTFGELTGDPGIVKLERSTMREPGPFAQEFIERQKQNDEAIRAVIAKQRPKGDIGNVLETYSDIEKKAGETVTKAQTQLGAETEKLGMGTGTLEAGQTIRSEASAAEKAARKKAGEMFKEIPQEKIDANPILNKIDELTTPKDPFDDITKNVPEEFGTIKEVLSESQGEATAKDLQNLRSRLTQRLRDMRTSGERNRFKESKMIDLIGSIDKSLDLAGEIPGEIGQKLKTARSFFKKEVIDKFQTGNVGDILKPGRSGYRVEDAQVSSKFFKPGASGKQAAMDFNAAIGENPKAKQAIEDAVKQDLLSKFSGEEITEGGLRRWLNRNKQALDELNLTNKFNNVKKAREQLTDALSFQKEFQKSEAAKVLGSDPDIAIKSALGAKNTGRAAVNLMQATKGNKEAQAGLRNALEDYILSQSTNLETGMITKIDTLDKLTKKYRPALNVFYNNDREALKAWDTVRKAFRIAQKERKSPIATGSDTAENMMTSLFKTIGLSSGRIGSLVRAVIDPLKKSEMEKMKFFLNRALLNPDYAHTLMLIAKDARNPAFAKTGQISKSVQRRLSQHLATIGGAFLRPLSTEEPTP
jgi:hypothetical protein